MVPASSPAPADIAAAFNAAVARFAAFRLELHWYPSLPSTMDVAAEAAQVGAPEGVIIFAEEQTAGRGRRGRSWSSPPGAGLYLSFIFRPPVDTLSGPLLSFLTLAAGVAVRDATARACGFAPELKWPNDVMVGRRKLAGILAEGVGIGTSAQTVVLGLGINIQRAAHGAEIARRATSVEQELGRKVERRVLLEELLVAVPVVYDRLRRGEADNILRAWRDAAPSAHGAIVEWETDQDTRRGTTEGIDDAGALLIRTANGVERVIAGELRWL